MTVPIAAGDTLHIGCNVTVPDMLTYTLNETLFFYDDNAVYQVEDANSNRTQNGNVFSKQIVIDPVKTSDAVQYYCIARFQSTQVMSNDTAILTVHCKFIYITCLLYCLFSLLVPNPMLSITSSQAPPIYESTQFNLTCVISPLPSTVDTPVTTSFIWLDSNGDVIANDTRQYSIAAGPNANTLVFDPIDNFQFNDSGQYQCQAFINSLNSTVVSSNSTIYSNFITVQSKQLLLPNSILFFFI